MFSLFLGFFILGDGGYPCIEVPVAIINPYKEPLQGGVQSHFNQHHASARSIIERAFGMMKTRWRSLLFKALEVHHTFVPSVITAFAVLHNICLTAGAHLRACRGRWGHWCGSTTSGEADMASETDWQGCSLLQVCTQ
ncbi:hypothetical protein F7725_000232 [Dissostichus mawsoni]|uniref:DDE Tnp4 domain-containing protein n=1 Tax=Dissostichus mawsoni TaxID=36200 RepID=A0A7J5ZH48_DISMA|nr:hypothetical protein F7725_000232 [Dissostichus mawsoni]